MVLGGVTVGYAIPGIVFSMCFVPMFHYSLPKPRPKGFKLWHVIYGVYIGFAIRLFLPTFAMEEIVLIERPSPDGSETLVFAEGSTKEQVDVYMEGKFGAP